jgi:hypothetical protein
MLRRRLRRDVLRQAQDDRGSPRGARAPEKNRRQLLVLCDDRLRLHPPHDAVRPPQTLSSEEVYAVTAYILARNHIIADDATLNAKT